MSIRKIGNTILLPLLLIFVLGVLILSIPGTTHASMTEQSASPHIHTEILTTNVPIDLPMLVVGTLEQPTVNVNTGELLDSYISIQGIPSHRLLSLVDLELHYDESLVYPLSCTENPEFYFDLAQCDLTTPGIVRMNGVSLVGLTGDADVALVTWNVFGPSGESTTFVVSDLTVADIDGVSIDALVQEQTIHITEDPNRPIIIIGNSDGSPLEVVVGQTFVTPVRAEHVLLPGFAAATINVTYDNSILRPVGCSEPNNIHFDLHQCNLNFDLDRLQLHMVASLGITSSSNLMDIRWEVIGTPGSTSIDLLIHSHRDMEDRPLYYATQNQMVNVTEGTMVSIGNPEDLVVVASGDTFKLPVSIRGITGPDVVAYDLAIHYDPSYVRPMSCEYLLNTPSDSIQCNLKYDSGVVRISGVSLDGVRGDVNLAELEWQVVGPPVDETILAVEVLILADENGESVAYATRDQVVNIIEVDLSIIISGSEGADFHVVEGHTFTTSLEIFGISTHAPMGGINLDIYYDYELLQPTQCRNHPDADFAKVLCNSDGELGRIRLNGTSKVGVSGDVGLAMIEWEVIRGDVNYTYLSPYVIESVDTNGNRLNTTYQDQSITILPLGDVNCDSQRSVVDGLFIMQYDLELRAGTDRCESEETEERILYLRACDVNDDGNCNPVDALFILQCNIGIPSPLCPEGTHFSNPEQASVEPDSTDQSTDQNGNGATLQLKSIRAGIPFTVAVIVDSDADIGSLDASLVYDPARLQPVSCQMTDHEGAGLVGCNLKAKNNQIRFSTIMPSGTSSSEFITEITFTPIGTAGDTDELDFQIHTATGLDGKPLDIAIMGALQDNYQSNHHLVYLPTIMH